MYYFAVVLFIVLSVMSTVNVACSDLTHLVYVEQALHLSV